MQPGRSTELFFLDEATAFAAGHRPCALCRRDGYVRLQELWRDLHPSLLADADAIDAQPHAERSRSGAQRHHDAMLVGLPDGSFVLREGDPWVVADAGLWRWTPAGYVDRTPRPSKGSARVITPPSLVSVLRSGWQPLVPMLHPSAT